MLKNKYQRFTKAEKKECQTQYYGTSKGKEMHIRLTRLTLTGCIGLLFSAFLLTNGLKEHTLKLADYLIMGVLSISSIVFLVASRKLKIKCLNTYAIKGMKKE